MKFRQIIELIVFAIMIIFLVLFFYQLFNKILGHSWISESLIIALLTISIGVTFANSIKLSGMSGEFKEHKRSFSALAHDFKEFRKEMYDFKTKQEQFNEKQENFNNWSRVQFRDIKSKI